MGGGLLTALHILLHQICALINLASLLESQSKYDKAEPMYWQALALREKALGEEHPGTLTGMNNLAGLLKS